MNCNKKNPYTFIHIDETDSTNNYLRNYNPEKPVEEFTTVIAAYQNAGKGQRGNSWESARGKNLLCSLLIYPHFVEAKEQFLLSQIISLSIQEELSCHATDFSIKWPNDIYWQDKKICGILIENDLSGTKIQQSIIGFGLNLNQSTFQSSAPNPVSLSQITGKNYSALSVADNILKRFILYYDKLQKEGAKEIRKNYHKVLYRKDEFYGYKDKKGLFKGKIVRVMDQGSLVIEDENRDERVYEFKEVTFEK